MQPSKNMHSSGIVLQQNNEQGLADTTYIIGLDASITSFGVYCAPVAKGEWYAFTIGSTSKAGTDTARVIDIAEEVIAHIEGLNIVMAVFEDYGPIGRTSGKITARAEICGIIKHHLLRVRKVPVIAVSPPSLKKYATGSGKASKDQVLDAAAQLGFITDCSDEADAFFAASIGRCILQGVRTGASFNRVNP